MILKYFSQVSDALCEPGMELRMDGIGKRPHLVEDMIVDISTDFINVPTSEIDTAIDLALKRIGRETGVDRSYVFQMSRDLSRMSNTHEWCAESIESWKQRLSDLPTEDFSYITDRLKRFDLVLIHRVCDLPQEAASVQRELEREQVQSVINVPMIAGGRLIGFVGFDSVREQRRWTEENITLLKIMADIFSGALTRKESEEALRESEQTARALLDASDDPAMLMDWKGTVLALNRSAAQMFQRTPEGMIGTSILRLFPQELVDTHRDYFRRVWKACESIRYEEQYLGRNWRLSVHPVKNPEGRVRRVALFARDITVQKLAEADRERQGEQMLQSQKLEAIGTMAGGVAHDFNNLLTGILGNINMAQLDGSESVQGFLKKAEMAAIRAATLVNQLLTFSRKSQSEFQVLDPKRLIDELCAMMRQTIDRRIIMSIGIDEKPWPVFADPGQIHQVLMNLCINARDAIMELLDEREAGTLEGGVEPYRIRIGLSNVQVGPEDCKRTHDAVPGRYVRFHVADNGPGMTENVRKRIFEPFFSTKEQGRGTGLGLSTAFGIVKQHKGWFEIESRVGQGSTFIFFLPVHQEEDEDKRIARASIKREEQVRTILLVDDEKFVRDLGEVILGRQGYKVLLAEDGKRGLELFFKEMDRIDLVILDLTMPFLSGKEVLQQIRLKAPHLKVLMSSGFVSPDQEKEFQELGAAGFVAKPYTIDELAGRVKSVLES